jgi:hypothetical protein
MMCSKGDVTVKTMCRDLFWPWFPGLSQGGTHHDAREGQ